MIAVAPRHRVASTNVIAWLVERGRNLTADDAERDSETGYHSATAAVHPEELRATVELRVGQLISIKARTRTTPAGLVTVALLISAILIPLVWRGKARAGERGRSDPTNFGLG